MDRRVRRQLAVVGIDGFSPVELDRFLSEGHLPALNTLARNGARIPLVSTLPATTPVAWASIVTGAPPSVTGIEGFLVHRPGDRLDRRVSGCYSYRCRAEPIWETATTSGKRAFVVKFPGSYPSSTATLRVDGAAGWGGLRCFHEVASTGVARSSTGDCLTPVDAAAGDGATRWRWRLSTLWGGGDIDLLVELREANDIPVARIALTDGRTLVTLRPGEMSSPLTMIAPGRRGPAECSFRIKLLRATCDPLSIDLFHTALHEQTGHSDPDVLWRKYLKEVGPIEEQTEPSLVFHAGLDLETQLEVFRLNADWLRRISTAILTSEEWDLFLVQIHIVDWAHHLLQGSIDPRHPQYDSSSASHYRRLLLEAYQLADALVGAVAEVLPSNADLVVLGDHGQDLQHSTFRINEWLANQGFLTWSDSAGEVDWSHTRAYATGNYIYLNIEGREPTGCVEPSQRESLRDSIIEGLLKLVDPVTGNRVVLIAGDKHEFELLGANGEGVGDVVFCLCSGYQATNGRGEVLSATVPLREFTSGHDHFWPLDPRIHTRMFAAGPRFRKNYAHQRVGHVCDVAATLCAALGIRRPRHAEGHVLAELFASEEDPMTDARPSPTSLDIGL